MELLTAEDHTNSIATDDISNKNGNINWEKGKNSMQSPRNSQKNRSPRLGSLLKWITGVWRPHIGVELPHEAGEVIVLEVLGEEDALEIVGIPHHEAVARIVPRHHRVGGRIVHHVIALAEEWRKLLVQKSSRCRRRRLGGRGRSSQVGEIRTG